MDRSIRLLGHVGSATPRFRVAWMVKLYEVKVEKLGTGRKLGTNWAHFNSMLLLITYTCNMHQITMVKGLGTQLAVTKFVE